MSLLCSAALILLIVSACLGREVSERMNHPLSRWILFLKATP